MKIKASGSETDRPRVGKTPNNPEQLETTPNNYEPFGPVRDYSSGQVVV